MLRPCASHLQASTMGFSHFVFVSAGRLVLGRWQAIYLAEFDGPRTREVLVKVLPDTPAPSTLQGRAGAP